MKLFCHDRYIVAANLIKIDLKSQLNSTHYEIKFFTFPSAVPQHLEFLTSLSD